MTSYDEDLLENPFYRALVAKCPELFEVATDSEWMVRGWWIATRDLVVAGPMSLASCLQICVPRLGSASRLQMNRSDFESHLLVPASSDDEERTFVTPNAKVAA